MPSIVESGTKKQKRIVDEDHPMEDDAAVTPAKGPVVNVQQEFSEELLRMCVLPLNDEPSTCRSRQEAMPL